MGITVHRLASHTKQPQSSSSHNEGFCCCSCWPLRLCQGSIPILSICWIWWIRWPSSRWPSSCCPSNHCPSCSCPSNCCHLCCCCTSVCPSCCCPAVSSQFHSQDEFGNTAHGYADINSAKHEQGNAYTGVTGSYSYVDANGVLQTTNYIADGLGFRVQATNLPVAPAAPEVAALEAPVFNLEAPVFDLVGPAPVEDTPGCCCQ